MKPDWKDAPEWAKWCAMDDDGEWYWFAREPFFSEEGVWRINGGAWEEAKVCFSGKDSLEPRP